MASKRKYPENWKDIALARKEQESNKCERCGIADSHEPKDGQCLTVHHLVSDTSINEGWNLAVLCQRCYLKMQHISLFQGYFFELSEWLKPHVDGFNEWRKT